LKGAALQYEHRLQPRRDRAPHCCCDHDPLGQPHLQSVVVKPLDYESRLNCCDAFEGTRQQAQLLQTNVA
jgi:hypothetical protein